MEPPAKRFSEHLFLPPATGLEGVQDAAKDIYYFATYDQIQIHEDMIRDSVRTQTYRYAMLQNKSLFADRVVVDVGCGTGILAMFAVQAGARHVYALERGEIAGQAERLIAANGMADRITVVRGLAEEAQLPEMADVLVSEWMGYFLLYEGMLESVLAVRDRWLRPEGIMFPSWATLNVALLSHPDIHDSRIGFWTGPHPMLGGIKLDALVPFAERCSFQQPLVEDVEGDTVASATHELVRLDLRKCVRGESAKLQKSFELSSMVRGPLTGLVGWFDVGFPSGVSFSTGPHASKSTHWRQTLFVLNKPLTLEQDTKVAVSFQMEPCPRNKRFLEFHIEFDVTAPGADDKDTVHVAQDFLLA